MFSVSCLLHCALGSSPVALRIFQSSRTGAIRLHLQDSAESYLGGWLHHRRRPVTENMEVVHAPHGDGLVTIDPADGEPAATATQEKKRKARARKSAAIGSNVSNDHREPVQGSATRSTQQSDPRIHCGSRGSGPSEKRRRTNAGNESSRKRSTGFAAGADVGWDFAEASTERHRTRVLRPTVTILLIGPEVQSETIYPDVTELVCDAQT